jgi:hypothetical protein
MNDGLIHPSFEDICQRQAQWIEELEGKATMQCVANGELRAEIAGLKAAMRASFDEHGSAPTDCDCSKCTRLAVLLDYLPGEHNHD